MSQTLDSDLNVVSTTTPKEARTPISSKTAQTLSSLMQQAVSEGTGSSAQVAGVSVAGKTGTAQVIGIRQNEKYDEAKVAHHFRDHSLYIGYAPAQNPRIALAMVVENGGFGADFAVPIGSLIMEQYLNGKLSAGSRARAESFRLRHINYGSHAR